MDTTEVICISSDDDELTEKLQTESPLQDNCVRTKIEKERGEPSIQKRRISMQEVTDSICAQTKRCRISLDQTENNNVSLGAENYNKSKSTCENGDGENGHKPQLVVKEKRSISPVEQHPFPMFISLCLQKDRSEEMKIIVNKLKTRYEQLCPSYSKSIEFIDFLNQQREAIMNSTKKLYSYIQNVMNEMKNSIKGQSQLRENSKNSKALDKKTETNVEISNDNTHIDDKKKNIKLELRIKKIDTTMEECQARIRRLEEAEMDFDDEENSNYMKLERYKKRMVELYNARCSLTGERTDAGRPYLRPKHLTPTGIAAVDAAISNFINSKINKRNRLKKKNSAVEAVIFPDYVDILRCIILCNDARDLGLSIKKQREIAKKAFIQLGEYLQRMRFNDYWDTFSSYLENQQEDPALNDSDLASKLVQNRKDGEKRLANVFQEFVNKQEAAKDRLTEGNGTTDQMEDEAEDKDDKDEEDDAEDEEELDDSVDENEENSETDQDSSAEDDVESTTNNEQSDTHKSKRLSNENDVTVNNIHAIDNDGSEVIELDDDTEVNGHAIVSESIRNCATSIKPLDKNSLQENHLKSASVRESPKIVDTTVTTSLNKELMLSSSVSALEVIPEVTNDSEGKNLPEIETQDSVNDTRWETDGTSNAQKDRQDGKIENNEKNKQDKQDSASNCKEDDKLNDSRTKNVHEDNEDREREKEDDAEDKQSAEAVQEENRNSQECSPQIQEVDHDIDQENIQDKPLLRVRAFARSPTTWKDGEHKNEKASKSKNLSNVSSAAEIIDLTDGPTVSEQKTLRINAKFGSVLTGKPFIVKLRKLDPGADPEKFKKPDITTTRVVQTPNELKNEATGRAVILNQANIVDSSLKKVIQSQPIKSQNILNKTAINGQPASVRPQFVTVSRAALNALRQLSVTPHQGNVPFMFNHKTSQNRSQPCGRNTQDNVSLKRSETNSAPNSSK